MPLPALEHDVANVGIWLCGANAIAFARGYRQREHHISGSTINREGEAIGSYYGLKALGTFQNNSKSRK